MRLFGAIVTNNDALSLNVLSDDDRRPWRDGAFFAMVDGPTSVIVMVMTAVRNVRRAETLRNSAWHSGFLLLLMIAGA
ncbi:MAG: hypothetical protein DMG02_28415 [Acidobacteria bacterium]|nr:MAG: hypothetical protein DMG02_28415 [Acidobacteriota bacterium]PYR13871.1 MAG: hypothetical protein DMF99_00140 [Acidobacteriota bacterium]